MTATQRAMTHEEIRRIAPSVFGEKPLAGHSSRYEMLPTIKAVEALEESGFLPVKAGQTRARSSIARLTTQHMIRFRHADTFGDEVILPDAVPEIVLYNSHDRTAAFRLMFGVFRKVCSNGMIVQSKSLGEIRLRHNSFVTEKAISAAYQLLANGGQVSNEILSWQKIVLNKDDQRRYAEQVGKALGRGFERMDPDMLISARRGADYPDENGDRNLWKTMNVLQENVIRGGIPFLSHTKGEDGEPKFRMKKAITGVRADEQVNRIIWAKTSEIALEA